MNCKLYVDIAAYKVQDSIFPNIDDEIDLMDDVQCFENTFTIREPDLKQNNRIHFSNIAEFNGKNL